MMDSVRVISWDARLGTLRGGVIGDLVSPVAAPCVERSWTMEPFRTAAHLDGLGQSYELASSFPIYYKPSSQPCPPHNQQSGLAKVVFSCTIGFFPSLVFKRKEAHNNVSHLLVSCLYS